MKKLNALSILLVNIILLLIVLNFYKNSSSVVDESRYYFENTNVIYSTYKNSKSNLYVKNDASKVLNKILKQLKIKNVNIVKSTKSLKFTVKNLTLQKQEKLINKILNEKFKIIKCTVEKNIVTFEIGLK